MRKDYTADTQVDAAPETAFIERYWTDIWNSLGDPKARLGRVVRQPEFRFLQRSLPPSGAVLDGGCGMGEWTVHLARQGYRAVGLDISATTVATLTRLFPEAEFAVRDIRATEFADASFDAYFSWGVFEHFEEGLQRCIAEAMRVLKPGAPLLISVPFDNARLRWLRRNQPPAPAMAPAGSRFYQWRLTESELRTELERGGFKVEAVAPIHKRQGLMRSLHHELGLPYGRVVQALATMLSPVIPGSVFGHMLIAVARKPS